MCASVNTEKEYHEEGKAKTTLTGDRLVPVRIKSVEEEPQISLERRLKTFLSKWIHWRWALL